MGGLAKGYLRIRLETTMPWPKAETVLEFGGHKITLSPQTEQHAPTLMVQFGDGFGPDEALRLLYEFATALAWAEGRAISLTFMTTCTSPSLMLGKGPSHGPIGDGEFNYLPRPADPKAKLALALFREGLTVNVVAYQFLAFCRIINLHVGSDRKQQIPWINAELPNVNERDAVARAAELQKLHSNIGAYLYGKGRCAAAHASLTSSTINPDDPDDSVRLHSDLPIVRALATRIIEHHLSVKSLRTVRKEHTYERVGRALPNGPKLRLLVFGQAVGVCHDLGF